MESMRVYAQGDWVASPVSGHPDERISDNYRDFLTRLDGYDMRCTNVATWHIEGQCVVDPNSIDRRSVDAHRNASQIDSADIVVTYLQRKDPVSRHWGSIALMAYAAGRNKLSIVAAPADCIVWKHHFVYHEKIVRLVYDDSHANAMEMISAAIASIRDTTTTTTAMHNVTQNV